MDNKAWVAEVASASIPWLCSALLVYSFSFSLDYCLLWISIITTFWFRDIMGHNVQQQDISSNIMEIIIERSELTIYTYLYLRFDIVHTKLYAFLCISICNSPRHNLWATYDPYHWPCVYFGFMYLYVLIIYVCNLYKLSTTSKEMCVW